MKRWLKGLGVGFLVALVGVGLGLSRLGSEFEQNVGLGWLFSIRGPVSPPDNVVVVAIDGRTGEHLDLPAVPRDWPRSIHARLIDKLIEGGATTIVFDIFFGRNKSPEDDQVLVDAVRRAKRVVLVELLTGKRQPISDQHGRHVGMVWTETTLPPFAELAKAAAALAPFPLPKEGAAVYQYWAFKESADNAPTMPAAALQLHFKAATAQLIEKVRRLEPEAIDSLTNVDQAFGSPRELRNFMQTLRNLFVSSGKLHAATGNIGRNSEGIPALQALEGLYAGAAHRYLNFYGPPGTILNVPYQAVIKGGDPNVPESALDFRGKTVFVGSSDLYDPGQQDRFYTVFTRDDGVDLAGVEIAATAYANLLTNKSLVPVRGWTALALLILFGIVIGVVVYVTPAIAGVPITIGLAALYAIAAQSLFDNVALLVPVATPLLVQVPLALFVGLLGQYLLERERGQRISDAINYYLPDEIARDLSENRLDESKINKVVFSACLATDMAGFSTISEELPPGELAKYLNDYFETLAAPLKKHGVHVTEFRADAIMCAWTAEEESVEPREQALLAALEAKEAIKAFGKRHELSEVRLRIGLEAGWVYVGHAGGGGRFVYSIVGDTANTASRVEGLNKHIGTSILATAEVMGGIDSLLTRHVGAFQFVGKTEAIPILEIMAHEEQATPEQLDLCAKFAKAMSLFDAGEWHAASEAFEGVLAAFPGDGPSEFLLQKCRLYVGDNNLSDIKPGVVRMDTK
jgi:adenylate cyclase